MFSWTSLIPLAGTLLGGLFGNTKHQGTTGTQNQTTNSTTKGGQSTSTEGQGTSNTTQSQNTTQQSNQSTTQQSTDQSAQQSSTSSAGTQTQTSSRLDQGTRDAISSQISDLLTKASSGANILENQLQDVVSTPNAFDANAFVNGIVKSATAFANSDLESKTNAAAASAGSSAAGNSAVSLLQNKERNLTAANLSGIRTSATQTAQQMKLNEANSRTGQISTLTGDISQQLQGLLSGLINAQETTTQQSSSQSGTTGTSSSTGSTTSNTQGTTSNQSTGTTATTTQQQQQQVIASQEEQNSNTNQTSSGTTNEQDNDWSKFFNDISSIFSTHF